MIVTVSSGIPFCFSPPPIDEVPTWCPLFFSFFTCQENIIFLTDPLMAQQILKRSNGANRATIQTDFYSTFIAEFWVGVMESNI